MKWGVSSIIPAHMEKKLYLLWTVPHASLGVNDRFPSSAMLHECQKEHLHQPSNYVDGAMDMV